MVGGDFLEQLRFTHRSDNGDILRFFIIFSKKEFVCNSFVVSPVVSNLLVDIIKTMLQN